MQKRTAAPALFFVAAIAFFAAGGVLLRSGSPLGAAFFVLGGAMIAIGAATKRRMGKRGS
jgi:hypothetical protein